MENNEKIIVSEDTKFQKFLKGLGTFILMFLAYVLVPSLVGSVFYYLLPISENVAMLIGNTTFILLLIAVYYEMIINKIKDYGKHFSRYFGTGLKYWAIGFLVMAVSNIILSYITGDIAANEEANREFISGNLFLGFYSVVIVAPFVEEMIFRFGVKKFVISDKWFPLVTAILFGLAHIVFADVSKAVEYLYLIPYGALGYAFGYIYNQTDNIYSSIILHAMHNFISFMAVAFMV